jgi:hypothetical protein
VVAILATHFHQSGKPSLTTQFKFQSKVHLELKDLCTTTIILPVIDNDLTLLSGLSLDQDRNVAVTEINVICYNGNYYQY